MIAELKHYTVIMAYPQGCSTHGYTARVMAQSPEGAVLKARVEAVEAQGIVNLYEPKDFFPIAVFAGWHDNIRPILINGEVLNEDVLSS